MLLLKCYRWKYRKGLWRRKSWWVMVKYFPRWKDPDIREYVLTFLTSYDYSQCKIFNERPFIHSIPFSLNFGCTKFFPTSKSQVLLLLTSSHIQSILSKLWSTTKVSLVIFYRSRILIFLLLFFSFDKMTIETFCDFVFSLM